MPVRAILASIFSYGWLWDPIILTTTQRGKNLGFGFRILEVLKIPGHELWRARVIFSSYFRVWSSKVRVSDLVVVLCQGCWVQSRSEQFRVKSHGLSCCFESWDSRFLFTCLQRMSGHKVERGCRFSTQRVQVRL